MDTENNGNLEALIQEKIDTDNDFQDSLVDLSEEEKETTINEKKKEIINSEYSSLLEKAKKNEELANNYKVRAEKAEKNKPKEDDTSKKSEDLSSKDLFALMEAKISTDDVDEVIKASKLLNKSIPETLKDETVQTILKTRVEHRNTANATNTGNARTGSKKISEDDLVSKASKGEFPDKGSEDAERLFWAKRGGRR